jgi:HEAT repeat protein
LKDPAVSVRQAAVTALAAIPDAKATDALLTALDDSDEQVFISAATELGRRKDSRAIDPLFLSVIYPMVDQPDDQMLDWRLLNAVGNALAQIGEPASTDLLVALLPKVDEMQRVQILLMLAKLPDPRVAGMLYQYLLQAKDKQEHQAILMAIDYGPLCQHV